MRYDVMNIKKLYIVLMCAICTVQASLRIEVIENRTADGLYTINLAGQTKIYVPPMSAVSVDDLLGTTLRNRIEMACIQGEYDPIYVNFEQGIFKCDKDHNSYMITLWIGTQTCLPSAKTYIPFCARTDAALKLVILESGIPEIEVLNNGYFL